MEPFNPNGEVWKKFYAKELPEFRAAFDRDPVSEEELFNFVQNQKNSAIQEKLEEELLRFEKVICALCSHNTVCRLMEAYAKGQEDFSCMSFSPNQSRPELLDKNVLNMSSGQWGYAAQNPAQPMGGYSQCGYPQGGFNYNPNFWQRSGSNDNFYVSLKFLYLFNRKRESDKPGTPPEASTK